MKVSVLLERSIPGWFILADRWLLDASSYLALVVADLAVNLPYAIVDIHHPLRVAETHLPL